MINDASVYLTRAKFNSYEKQLAYMEGDWNKELSELLASSPGSGMGRPLDLPIHDLARTFYSDIKKIKHILRYAVIIDDLLKDTSVVYIGATVILSNLDMQYIENFVILGPDEANPENGKISHVSPLGSVLLGKKEGELIKLSPTGEKFQIKKIQYQEHDYSYKLKDWGKIFGTI